MTFRARIGFFKVVWLASVAAFGAASAAESLNRLAIPEVREPLLPGALSQRAEGAKRSEADRGSAPEGYRLVFQERFDSPDALKAFRMTDPSAWRYERTSQGGALELFRQSEYEPPARSPFNIALIDRRVVGDFVLEADLKQTGREYGHRDMCVFFGFQNPARFYYVHLASAADDHAHNIFVVKDAPRVKMARPSTEGVEWGTDQWHRVRLERNIGDGAIRVFFDGELIMETKNSEFQSGAVGFGSFDDTGAVDNIRLWAPAVEGKPLGFFKAAAPER